MAHAPAKELAAETATLPIWPHADHRDVTQRADPASRTLWLRATEADQSALLGRILEDEQVGIVDVGIVFNPATISSSTCRGVGCSAKAALNSATQGATSRARSNDRATSSAGQAAAAARRSSGRARSHRVEW